jgi:hypothetical protein
MAIEAVKGNIDDLPTAIMSVGVGVFGGLYRERDRHRHSPCGVAKDDRSGRPGTARPDEPSSTTRTEQEEELEEWGRWRTETEKEKHSLNTAGPRRLKVQSVFRFFGSWKSDTSLRTNVCPLRRAVHSTLPVQGPPLKRLAGEFGASTPTTESGLSELTNTQERGLNYTPRCRALQPAAIPYMNRYVVRSQRSNSPRIKKTDIQSRAAQQSRTTTQCLV